MNYFVQYHNVANEGLLLSDPPFSASRLSIHTSLPGIKNAKGRVFLIAGVSRPRRYFLWETFEIEKVRTGLDGQYHASGTGWQLAPPVELTGTSFEEFQKSCANFVGFRTISESLYTRMLDALPDANRPPGDTGRSIDFLTTIDSLQADDVKNDKSLQQRHVIQVV
jgi:hypothetical protein